VAAAGSLWVRNGEGGGELLRVDPVTERVLARFAPVDQVVAVGRGFVWALSFEPGSGGRLVRIDTETSEVVPLAAPPDASADFAVAGGAVWASGPQDGTIVRLDPVTGQETGRIHVVPAPAPLAAGAGSLWVANERDGAVVRYDLSTGRVETIPVGGAPSDLVFARGSIWVAVDGSVQPAAAERVGVAPLDGCGRGNRPAAPVSEAAVAAAAVTAEYRFDSSLVNSVGVAPPLVEIGDRPGGFAEERVVGRRRTVLRFARGGGLLLAPAAGVVDTGEYTIELLFRLDRLGGWRKLIDFEGGTADSGLYSCDGRLNLFPAALASRPTIERGSYAHVVLTRDTSETVAGYVDGVRQFAFLDADGLALIDGNDTLRFFSDDSETSGRESSGGAVSLIRLYDGPLTESEVARACAELLGRRCRSSGEA
jgi:streptogramin lyase